MKKEKEKKKLKQQINKRNVVRLKSWIGNHT